MCLVPTYLAGLSNPFVAIRMIIATLSAVQTLTSDLIAATGTPTGENTRPSTSRRVVETTRVTYNNDGNIWIMYDWRYIHDSIKNRGSIHT